SFARRSYLPLITRDDFALVLGEDVTQERFDALYRRGLSIVRTGYRGDPEAASDDARETVASVLFGVMVRIIANPKGARAVAAGRARSSPRRRRLACLSNSTPPPAHVKARPSSSRSSARRCPPAPSSASTTRSSAEASSTPSQALRPPSRCLAIRPSASSRR